MSTIERGPGAVEAFHAAMLAGGREIEIGEEWDAEQGWRVYMATGDKQLSLSAEAARQLAAYYDATSSDAPDLALVINTLKASAEAVERHIANGLGPAAAMRGAP